MSTLSQTKFLREIKGGGYAIDYFIPKNHMIFNIYEEQALYELVNIARIYKWQVFDTGCREMINLDHSEKDGYENFLVM